MIIMMYVGPNLEQKGAELISNPSVLVCHYFYLREWTLSLSVAPLKQAPLHQIPPAAVPPSSVKHQSSSASR